MALTICSYNQRGNLQLLKINFDSKLLAYIKWTYRKLGAYCKVDVGAVVVIYSTPAHALVVRNLAKYIGCVSRIRERLKEGLFVPRRI